MINNSIFTTEKLISTLANNGKITLEMREEVLPKPGLNEVIIAVEATPVNPVDMMFLWPGMDLSSARLFHTPDGPRLEGAFPGPIPESLHIRLSRPVTPGLEGAGVVVATGNNVEHLAGKRVAATSPNGGMYARHCTVDATNCIVLPDHITAHQGASFFTNPLTVAAILETLRMHGQRALIHTAAASNLGLMLAKACIEDNLDMIAVVRRKEQAITLQKIGLQHICNSNSPDFMDNLVHAAESTGAMIAFDAIGGGDMPHQLLSAMTTAHRVTADKPPYSAQSRKRVYIYGRLKPDSPKLRPSAYGGLWSIEGWAMPEILELAGEKRSALLRERILQRLDSTFSSHYSEVISLPEIIDLEVLTQCFQKRTGGKYLIAL